MCRPLNSNAISFQWESRLSESRIEEIESKVSSLCRLDYDAMQGYRFAVLRPSP
jgi:hypothetical protein